MTDQGPSTVTFTVKELLSRIESKIDSFSVDVGARLAALEQRVAALEQRGVKERSFISGVSKPLLAFIAFVAWVAPMLVAVFK